MRQRIELPPEVTEVDHGPSDLRVDIRLSLDVAEAVEAEPKGCYLAAYRTVDEGILEDAEYVEGYTVHPDLPIPIQHAWVEWPDRIIDPVYCSFSPNEERRYFPGIRLTWEQMMALNEANPGTNLPYCDYCSAQRELREAVQEAYYAANEYLSPGWGDKLRHMDQQVRRHNRLAYEQARAARTGQAD